MRLNLQPKKKIIFIFSFFFILTTTISAQAAAPIAQIQALLIQPNILCGRFEQTKHLVGIQKPLLSNGRFCVVAGKGILWRTLQPFPNTLRVTPDDIVQIQNNQVAMRLDAKQEPVVGLINSVLFSLLAGDLAQLTKLFNLNGHLQNNQWQVKLTAREPALAQAIGTVTLQGSQHVKKVSMQEMSGDRTDIVFSDIQSGNHAMSAEEGKWLGQP